MKKYPDKLQDRFKIHPSYQNRSKLLLLLLLLWLKLLRFDTKPLARRYAPLS